MPERKRLPRLLSCKTLAAELGVNESTAGRIMRHVPKVQIDGRVFVKEQDVRDYLNRHTTT